MIPCGQICGANSDNPAYYNGESDLFAFGKWEEGIYLHDTGQVNFSRGSDGVWITFDAPAMWPIETYGLWAESLMDAGMRFYKYSSAESFNGTTEDFD